MIHLLYILLEFYHLVMHFFYYYTFFHTPILLPKCTRLPLICLLSSSFYLSPIIHKIPAKLIHTICIFSF